MNTNFNSATMTFNVHTAKLKANGALNSNNTTNGNTFNIVFGQTSTRELNRTLRENTNNMIVDAHNTARARRQEQRSSGRQPRVGSVRLSNTDTPARAQQIRSQLLAKLNEIFDSDLDDRAKQALAAEIQMHLNNVDKQVAAMRRRQQAIQMEQTQQRMSEAERRRRRHDREERSIFIREELLYSAEDGGLCPAALQGVIAATPEPVSFTFNVSTADVPMPSMDG